MKYPPKKNAAAESAYVRDLERHRPLEKVERGEVRMLTASEYPEPIKRFLARQRGMLHFQLSLSETKKLEQLSRATGLSIDELARRWVEQGIEREAGDA